MAAAEAAPYAKVGGLADVAGSLPAALAELGCEVELVMPGYASIDRAQYGFVRSGRVELHFAGRPTFCDFSQVRRPDGVTVTLLEDGPAFGRPGIYDDPATKEGYSDNPARFAYFSRIVAELAVERAPDLVHVHDSHAALVPGLLRVVLAHRLRRRPPVVLTIHNLAYQMQCPPEPLFDVGFPRELFQPMSPLEYYGRANFLKTGIAYADAITTVSRRYALEIQTPELGNGLDGLLRYRSGDLFGILNGIDVREWNPETDPLLPANYSVKDLKGKDLCRQELLRAAHLDAAPGTPIVGMVGRLVDQKGLDIFAEAANVLARADVRFAILGSGQEKYHQLLGELQRRHPDKFAVYFGFNNQLAHRIEAGSDFFLMPSRFEPCGLNQMYSLRYGTIPIVRRTGGLADTVTDVEENRDRGTGFVFDAPHRDALLHKMHSALSLYRREPERIAVMRRGMLQDFSGRASAQKYLALFERLVRA